MSAWAAKPFTRMLTPEGRASAGVDQLTPAQPAALDELVRKYESGSYVSGSDLTIRKVRIEPGVLGAFFLRIDGVSVRPKVRIVGH